MGPFLVVVSGLPAAGKSTLSRRLAHDLPAPLISRDKLNTSAFEEIRRLPESWPFLPEVLSRFINGALESIFDAGGGAVLDGNFNTVEHAVPLRRLLESRGESLAVMEVCLWGDTNVLRERFIERADPPLTPDLEPYFETVLHREHWTVLASPAPIIEIDNTDVGAVEARYVDVLSRARRLMG
jgi:predicted kinase